MLRFKIRGRKSERMCILNVNKIRDDEEDKLKKRSSKCKRTTGKGKVREQQTPQNNTM